MALAACKPSEMRRMVISRHTSDMLDKNAFYQYFIEAICFSEGEASPLFGWLPNGTGELQDSNIDYLMTRRIQKNKGIWENAPKSS
jgi:hypothetical protein